MLQWPRTAPQGVWHLNPLFASASDTDQHDHQNVYQLVPQVAAILAWFVNFFFDNANQFFLCQLFLP